MRNHVLVAAIATMSLGSASAFAEEARLRYTYPTEPVVYRFVTQSDNEMAGAMFGKGIKSSLKIASICQLKKLGTDGDSSKVELVYKSVKFRQDTPGGKSVYFDPASAQPKAENPDAVARMMGVLIDKPIVLTIDPRGHVMRVENMGAVLESVKAAGADDPLGEATVETIVKPERLTRMLEDLFAMMPEGAVKTGSTWSTSSTLIQPPVGSLKQTVAWTFAGEESHDKQSLVHLKGDQTIEVFEDKEKAGSRPAGSEVKADPSESKGTLDVLFDAKAGLVQRSSSSWGVKIDMAFKAENASLKLQAKLKSAGTATLVEAGAPVDPDNVITPPDAAATKRSTTTEMTPLGGKPSKDESH